MKNKQPLVVTTAHKGVFFGYGEMSDAKTIVLTNARMCVYWPSDVKGVLGLASKGPTSGSRITFAVPSITLLDVTSVIEIGDDAVKAWEKGFWS
jgi:hypothetical protein